MTSATGSNFAFFQLRSDFGPLNGDYPDELKSLLGQVDACSSATSRVHKRCFLCFAGLLHPMSETREWIYLEMPMRPRILLIVLSGESAVSWLILHFDEG